MSGGFLQTANPISVPSAVTEKIMLLAAEVGNLTEFPHQIAEDIWICRNRVHKHEDRGADGCVTYGIILHSPKTFRFFYRDFFTDYHHQGTPFVMDARLTHALEPNGFDDLIAFMAWDIPHDYTIQGFLKQAVPSLEKWARS